MFKEERIYAYVLNFTYEIGFLFFKTLFSGELSEFAQIGQRCSGRENSRSVMCEEENIWTESVFVKVLPGWKGSQGPPGPDHRLSHGDGVSEAGGAQAKPLEGALPQSYRDCRVTLLRASDKHSWSLLHFSLSQQDSWLPESDFEGNRAHWHRAHLCRE